MKILVTGGHGFIGSHLIKALLDNFDVSVLNVDRRNTHLEKTVLGEASNKERLSVEVLDICEAEKLDTLVKTFQPNVVFNLAAQSHVDRSIDQPTEAIDSNIRGTLNLLEACRQGLSSSTLETFRFIQVSTDEVFGFLGKGDAPWTEQAVYNPSSPYSASKAAANHLASAWFKTYALPSLITYASNTYGPYQMPEKLIPMMVNKALRAEHLPVYGNGQQIRDWLFIDDHVSGLLKVMQSGVVGESYNIGGNHEISNIDLVKKVCDLLDVHFSNGSNTSLHKLIRFVEDRPAHDFRYALNSDKLGHLGWSINTDFEKGLYETVSWYVQHQDWSEQFHQQFSRQGLL